jgi:hypothetical protein
MGHCRYVLSERRILDHAEGESYSFARFEPIAVFNVGPNEGNL